MARRVWVGVKASMASEKDALEAVKLLWDIGGFDINAASVSRQTALHGATFRGAASIIQFLADHGARLDLKDINGRTAPMRRPASSTARDIHPGRKRRRCCAE
jgi:ankyrin repeat protein